MKNDLHHLFIVELKDMYSSENQILEALPKLIKSAAFPELKEALSHHLKETQNQVKRLETIFSLLGLEPEAEECPAMRGILKEAQQLIRNKKASPILDAAIICAAQKVEHYEIASYGTLRSFAKHLNLGHEIRHLLQQTLDEEAHADKKLSKLADGSLFSNGINAVAAEMVLEYAHK